LFRSFPRLCPSFTGNPGEAKLLKVNMGPSRYPNDLKPKAMGNWFWSERDPFPPWEKNRPSLACTAPHTDCLTMGVGNPAEVSPSVFSHPPTPGCFLTRS
jgi:hypothetical protein